jgi:phosphoribosylformylglycinamidine synthase II
VSTEARVSARTLRITDASDSQLEQQLSSWGLNFTLDEARKVASLLGRDPTVVEAHIFNTMWSEHCSYKSSKDVLKEHLPTEAPNVVLGPGEDAGIVRLCEIDGRTYCVAIAHESHNHPSQIVPNEGAATGIGGIVRDVYCMGADVIGVMDPLRFGDPTGPNAERTREIVHGVVEGIWQYGNALGVPNLGGDVYFDRSFDDNCLVNVVAIGLVEESEIKRSRVPAEARGEPYDVILVGKPTDPSGFGGATFASRILDEEKALDDKYAVQIPDPFLKRMITVATADVLKLVREKGVSIGFKDLGAGGIACATSELGAAAGLGVRIDLSKVPVAEDGMLPEVIACSETQERYALVVPRGLTPHVLRIFNDDYELPELCHGARAEVIGEVIEEARFVLVHEGEVVCDASTEAITTGISYTRETHERQRPLDEPQIPTDLDLADAILRVVGSPNVASCEHVYRHYDGEVKGNTLVRPGEADAGVIAPIPDAFVGVAVSADGNPFLGALDPYQAGAAAVAEAVRNVAAVGAVPIALTDCLNFGDPENPEVFHDFVEAVRGIGDAARGIGQKDLDEPIPVVSGNVSFYNQSSAGSAILPSPIVCCVGLIADVRHHLTMGVKGTGNALYVLGERTGTLGGSAFMRTVLGSPGAHVPRVRFEDERMMMAAVTDLADRDLAAACHDISDGGLVVSVVEMLLTAAPDLAVGAQIDLSRLTGVDDPAGAQEACRRLFSEAGGYVLEVTPENETAVRSVLHDRGLCWARIGETTEARMLVLTAAVGGDVEIPIDTLAGSWNVGATEVML